MGVMYPVIVGLRLAEVWEVVEFDNMELMVGTLDSLADLLLETLGTEGMLAFELVAGFDSLDDSLETVVTGTTGLVEGDTAGLLTFELTGHFDLEGVSGTSGT